MGSPKRMPGQARATRSLCRESRGGVSASVRASEVRRSSLKSGFVILTNLRHCSNRTSYNRVPSGCFSPMARVHEHESPATSICFREPGVSAEGHAGGRTHPAHSSHLPRRSGISSCWRCPSSRFGCEPFRSTGRNSRSNHLNLLERYRAAFAPGGSDTGARGAPGEPVLCDLLAWTATGVPRTEILFWRPTKGAEVDFVIETRRRLLPVEVKPLPRSSRRRGAGGPVLDEYRRSGAVRDRPLRRRGNFPAHRARARSAEPEEAVRHVFLPGTTSWIGS